MYELMIRDGYYLPDESSKFVNQKMLQKIREKKVFAIQQREVFFRICATPPSKSILVNKY